MNSTFANGIKIYSFKNRRELIHFAAKEKKCLIAVNAEKILNATDQLRELINKNIGYADGIGAVWSLKRKGFKNTIKIPGCELWYDITKFFYKNKSFYFVGAQKHVIEKTVIKLKSTFPEINILGYRDGYIKSKREKEVLIIEITSKKPDIVFVAMGSPKQELLIQEMQKHHEAIYQGLGGSFDVYTGNVKRAPSWWVKNNLEWAYRLIKEPIRIKRQFKLLIFFFYLIINRL